MVARKAIVYPHLTWKTRLFISIMSVITLAASRPDGTINRRLLRIFEVRSKPNGKSIDGVKSKDIKIDRGKNLWFRLFYKEAVSTRSSPVIVFFHGGGFAFLSPDTLVYDRFCRRLCSQTGAMVVSVNYRLTPEHKFPAQYDDGYDVLSWIDNNPTFEGVVSDADPGRLFLAGDSAGANIAHHVAVRFLKEGGFGRVRVVGVVSLQPFFGGEKRAESETRLAGAPIVSVDRTDWLWKAFLPDGSDRDHPAVNVVGPKSTVEIAGLEFPPTMVVVGGFDPLQDRQREYAKWLKENGKAVEVVEYEHGIHAFYLFPEFDESFPLLQEVAAFVYKHAAICKDG